MAKRKRTKGQTTIYKTLHRKLKINQHEPYLIVWLMTLKFGNTKEQVILAGWKLFFGKGKMYENILSFVLQYWDYD
jgi:hypothetical protein